MSTSELLHATIETLFNRYVALDPVARERLAKLHGKVIAVELKGVETTLYLIPATHRLMVVGSHEGDPDCCMSGTPLALIKMINSERNSEQLFSGEVVITGNTELAHRFGKILADMDVDWEEQLSHLTGDAFAHGAGSLFRELTAWGRNTVSNFGLDVGEYLQHEIQLLPPRVEIEAFLDQVDDLRDDTERLEARIRRLERIKAAGEGS